MCAFYRSGAVIRLGVSFLNITLHNSGILSLLNATLILAVFHYILYYPKLSALLFMFGTRI